VLYLRYARMSGSSSSSVSSGMGGGGIALSQKRDVGTAQILYEGISTISYVRPLFFRDSLQKSVAAAAAHYYAKYVFILLPSLSRGPASGPLPQSLPPTRRIYPRVRCRRKYRHLPSYHGRGSVNYTSVGRCSDIDDPPGPAVGTRYAILYPTTLELRPPSSTLLRKSRLEES
jgi:hypothetical protein